MDIEFDYTIKYFHSMWKDYMVYRRNKMSKTKTRPYKNDNIDNLFFELKYTINNSAPMNFDNYIMIGRYVIGDLQDNRITKHENLIASFLYFYYAYSKQILMLNNFKESNFYLRNKYNFNDILKEHYERSLMNGYRQNELNSSLRLQRIL